MNGVEGLESRGYLSGVVIYFPHPYDVEQVVGRKNRFDEILVTADPRRASKVLVTVNGVGRKYPLTTRLRLEIVARGGDDHVVIDTSVSCVSVADGGAGDDVLEVRGAMSSDLSWDYNATGLFGGAGNDRLVGGSGRASLDGGDGNDTLISGTAGDSLSGGWGDDSLVGAAGSSASRPQLDGGSGDDTIRGGGGPIGSDLYGGPGRDSLFSGAAGDSLFGGRGDDSLVGNGSGGAGFDAGQGNDTVLGTGGPDTILGGLGSDRVDGRGGNDRIDGDTGWLLVAWDVTGPLEDTLLGGDGEDTIYGNSGNDRIDGGNAHDLLGGDQGNDTVTGGAGDDVLSGDTEGGRAPQVVGAGVSDWGNDSLDGGAGNDWLVGNLYHDWNVDGPKEHDTLTGGPGADVIDGYEGNDNDVITDRGGEDFVPADAQIWPDMSDANKHITLSLALPDGDGAYPVDLPSVMYVRGDLSFTTGWLVDHQIVIKDSAARPFVLRDYFVAWALPIDARTVGRYRITSATVNGVERPDIANYVPKDGDVINIRAE